MRRLALLYIAALVTVSMVGCAKPLHLDILSGRPVTPQRIDDLVADEAYGEALDLLSGVPETDPQYALLQEKRAEVHNRAAEYERIVLGTMRRKMEENNWSGALDAVESGLDRLPSSVALQHGRAELLTRRAQRIDELETELLIAKGKWLAEDAPLREDLAGVKSGNLISRWNLSRRRDEVRETAEELVMCAERAKGEQRFDEARTCLALVERLDSSESTQGTVRTLRKEIADSEAQAQREKLRQDSERLARQAEQAMDQGRWQKSQAMILQLGKIDPDNPDVRRLQERLDAIKDRARNEKLKQDYERLAREAQEAIEKGELLKAQQIMPKLARIDPDNPDVRELQERLNASVSGRVDLMLKRGSTLYRQGKIEEAKEAWEEVLGLDPSNTQAKEGVERAERVLKRLRVLKEQKRPVKKSTP